VPRVQQIPPPPTPPDNIVTDQDRQTAVAYEQWLAGQQQSLAHQLSNLETQVSRFRKAKKVGDQKAENLRGLAHFILWLNHQFNVIELAGFSILFISLLHHNAHKYKMPNETQLKKATIKEVIRIKKTFDMCYQTLRNPFTTNKMNIGQMVYFFTDF
jgi:hypothetical protein